MRLTSRPVRTLTVPALPWLLLCAMPLALGAQGSWVVAPRYASDGEGAVFAGRLESGWIAGEEFTFDVRAHGWALAVGAGPRFWLGPVRVSVLAGPVVDLPDWYAGLYLAPSYQAGRLSAGGTIELFAPLTHGAVAEYELSHARVFYRTGPALRIGGFLHLVREGEAWAHLEAGPSLRVALTDGLSVTGDAAKGFAHTPSFVLVTFEWSR